MRTISIAKDFSPYPAGRFRRDGPFSGEQFREDLLEPSVRNESEITIDFDGARGYGSSFMEEAFGGLVRLGRATPEELHRKFKLVTRDRPSLVDEVWLYIDEAKPQKK